jgi:hypothetical protein
MFIGENIIDPKFKGRGEINIAGDWVELELIIWRYSLPFY